MINPMGGKDMVKGAAVREMIVWLRGRLGAEQMRQAFASLPPALSESFDIDQESFGILPHAWYPAEATNAFMAALTQGMPRSVAQKLAYEGSQAALTVTLSGVHRAVLRMIGSPELHARLASTLWNVHFSTGRVHVERVGKTQVHVIYSDWHGHGRFACDMCTASDLVIYGAMGLRDVGVHQLRCVDDGAADCAHAVTWRP
jgi:hypothetical protein